MNQFQTVRFSNSFSSGCSFL